MRSLSSDSWSDMARLGAVRSTASMLAVLAVVSLLGGQACATSLRLTASGTSSGFSIAQPSRADFQQVLHAIDIWKPASESNLGLDAGEFQTEVLEQLSGTDEAAGTSPCSDVTFIALGMQPPHFCN